MRLSEMESFNKLFDRVGRMWQNLKQQQAQQQAQQQQQQQEVAAQNQIDAFDTTGMGVTNQLPYGHPHHQLAHHQHHQQHPLHPHPHQQQHQQQQQQPSPHPLHQGEMHLSASTTTSITPSPCQPYPLHAQLSSQSSIASSSMSPQSQPYSTTLGSSTHALGSSITNNNVNQSGVPFSQQSVQATFQQQQQQYQQQQQQQQLSQQQQQHHHHHPTVGQGHHPTSQQQHHHAVLVASSSQPLMPSNLSSTATSPHYAYSCGGGGTSTTSNSPSSCSAVSPAPAQSYSAVQTPDSPVGFPRRQLSLTVGQRSNHASGKLHLDLNRKPKNAGSQGSIFSNTNDVINQHSLSPRPRPRNLGLSNSHDNMYKPSPGRDSGSDGSGRHHHNGPLTSGHSSRQYPSRECLAPLSFNTPTHGLGGKSGHYNPPPPPPRTLKDEFAKNNRTIDINDRKYENIEENDFRKISELGNGTFGQVEKMLHIPSNTEFAVKKMRRSGNQDDNKHIINDLDMLRMCTNFPHIVQCCGYYIMETEVWIFMELMTICFDRLLKRLTERIPETIVGKIAVATVEALNYLKVKLSIIHRDVKPSNILINREGVIKLCDFGISGRLIDSKAHSRSVGCAAYMAPERIQPDSSGTYDVRSDVWSLGITLVEIATGKFPYQGWKSDFELLSKVIQDSPPTLPTDAGFSQEFQNFTTDCLMKEYHDRPKYNELMKKPFFVHYKQDTDVDVAEWFNRAFPPES